MSEDKKSKFVVKARKKLHNNGIEIIFGKVEHWEKNSLRKTIAKPLKLVFKRVREGEICCPTLFLEGELAIEFLKTMRVLVKGEK